MVIVIIVMIIVQLIKLKPSLEMFHGNMLCTDVLFKKINEKIKFDHFLYYNLRIRFSNC